jgi:hypothetical protein
MPQISCSNCGRTTHAEAAYSGVYTPNGWKQITRWFKATLYFCCDRCEKEYKERNP